MPRKALNELIAYVCVFDQIKGTPTLNNAIVFFDKKVDWCMVDKTRI
jgi:hypothetical protein